MERSQATWSWHLATVCNFLGVLRRRRWLTGDLTVNAASSPKPAEVPGDLLAEPERLRTATVTRWMVEGRRAVADEQYHGGEVVRQPGFWCP